MIRNLLRFLWRRDSESACILMIGLAEYLSQRDAGEMAEYLTTLRDVREKQGEPNESP